ncbi:MAG: hypothetical protein WA309_00760 [Pseudolabrys sp.]
MSPDVLRRAKFGSRVAQGRMLLRHELCIILMGEAISDGGADEHCLNRKYREYED